MSWICVCPLAHLGAVLESSGARSILSLVSPSAEVPLLPAHVRRLRLDVSDITEARPGHVLASPAEVDRLIAFLRAWDRTDPLLIHCYAGVSRSTAAAFVGLCALDPQGAESDHAQALRCASPFATPNARLVALADIALGRNGRMVAAVASIGRGADCFEGNVFTLALPTNPAGARGAEMS